MVGQRALHGLEGLIEIRILSDGVLVTLWQELVAQGVEHGTKVPIMLQAHESSPGKAPGAGEPAGQLDGQRGLALTAGAAYDGPRLAVKQAFQRQQFAATPLEMMRWRLGQSAET